MKIQFFGQYLIENGILTPQQLLEAIRYQDAKNLKFGEYARDKGFLTDKQVVRLNDEQKRNDMRIGELAVKLELLDGDQVERILTMQKNDHVLLGEAIVLTGHMDKATVEKHAAAFRAEQEQYPTEKIIVPDQARGSEVVSIMADLTLKMLRRVAHMEAKAAPGTIMTAEPAASYCAVSITFSGGFNCDYVLLADEAVSRVLTASVIGDDAADESAEIVIDGVREFANIVCGNILAGLAKIGRSMEISIPHLLDAQQGYALSSSGTAIDFPIVTTTGKLNLVIVEY